MESINLVNNLGMLMQAWLKLPADLAEKFNIGARAGENHGKPWLVSCKFTPTDTNVAVDVEPARLITVGRDQVNHPNRPDTVKVDLQDFINGGHVRGSLELKILQIQTMGGAASPLPGQGVIAVTASDGHSPRPDAEQYSTAIHEFGHCIGMVVTPETTGLDRPAKQYSMQGSHCAEGMDAHQQEVYRDNRNDAGCVMFQAIVVNQPLLDFCNECKLAVKKLDLSRGFDRAYSQN